ncbi:hypothetical protein TNCV_545591 [Trichonephila clavipes]|nr:hypothetical protein TNCV_545591 [Trichonephila clavipes]
MSTKLAWGLNTVGFMSDGPPCRTSAHALQRPRKSTVAMSYDYTACERSLECLFSLSALVKIKILVQARIVRAQVPSSGEETGCQNYLWQLVSSICVVTRYKGISVRGKCTMFAKVKNTNEQSQ